MKFYLIFSLKIKKLCWGNFLTVACLFFFSVKSLPVCFRVFFLIVKGTVVRDFFAPFLYKTVPPGPIRDVLGLFFYFFMELLDF